MRTQTFMVSALAAFSVVGVSCSNSSKLTFVVSNIPSDAKTISLKAKINNADYKIETVPVSQSEGSAKLVSVEVPFDVRGLALYITINAANDKCQLAEWTGSVGSVDGKDYTVNSPLSTIKDDPINQDLFSITAINENDVWVGGSNSTVGHWDGCYWRSAQIDQEGITGLVKMYYHKNSGLWALGANSTIAKYDNGKWIKLDHKNPWSLTGEFAQKILWLDMAFSEGSTEQLIVIGFNTIPGTPPTTQQVCRALRITKANGQYVFDSSIESKICNIPGATAARSLPVGTTHTASLFYPFKLASFSNGMIVTGLVYVDKKVGASTTSGIKYSAYARYQDQINLTNPVIKYINPLPPPAPQYTNPDDPQGNGGPIWGISADNFWFGSPMLHHVTGTINSPVVTSADYVYPPGSNYVMGNLWGGSDRDFWTVGLGANRVSEVLHIYDKTGAGNQVAENNIVPLLYSTPVNNLTITNIAGASTSDAWMVGYGGYRVHYTNSKYVLYQK